MSFVYLEGAFLPKEEARIPLSDRGLLFGDGAYATIRVENGVARYLELHLERLNAQCRSFGLQMPTLEVSAVEELIRLNGAQENTWRLKIVVTGGDDPAYHLPTREGRLFMTLVPYTPAPEKVLNVGIFPHPFHLCHAQYKSLAHLNRFYVMEEARRQGVDDCLTLTEEGIVLECAFGNICWIVDKTLYTPSRELPLYFGVTITKLIEQKRDEGFNIEEVAIPLKKLPQEGAFFRTNSMGGVRPVRVLQRLRQELHLHPH